MTYQLNSRASEIVKSRSFSISPGLSRVTTQARSTELINERRCEPTVKPEDVYSIPSVLLQSVYEANLARFGRFCSEQYVLDPRSDPMTSQNSLVLWLLEQKMNKPRC